MRLIDEDALIDFIDLGYLRNPSEICFSECDVVDLVKSRPAVDAVPVVRCRECWHRDPEDKKCDCGCWHFPFVTKDDDFCSYGERKEEHGV